MGSDGVSSWSLLIFLLPIHYVVLCLHFLVLWDCGVQFLFWNSCTQPGFRWRKGCHICHYLSWIILNPSVLFSNFRCCISKGSLFRLFTVLSLLSQTNSSYCPVYVFKAKLVLQSCTSLLAKLLLLYKSFMPNLVLGKLRIISVTSIWFRSTLLAMVCFMGCEVLTS